MAQRLQVADQALLWETYQARYQALADEALSVAGVSDWLLRWSALDSEVGEVWAKLTVWADLNTTSEEIQQRQQRFVSEVLPQTQRAQQQLSEKWLALEDYTPAPEVAQWYRRTRAEAALFREENVPLGVQHSEQCQQHSVLIGNQKVDWKGEQLTVPQIHEKLGSNDRSERQEAWTALTQSQLELAPKLDALFLELLKTRRQIARNADQPDVRAYYWKSLDRVDYTPDDCAKFHEAVHLEVVPVLREWCAKLQQDLGLERFRPWDFSRTEMLDPAQRPPLRPFQTEEELRTQVRQTLNKLDPELEKRFVQMEDEGLLDLMSRQGKVSHAYCNYLPTENKPFVLMNAVGTANDIQVCFHELGHAFHAFYSGAAQEIVHNRWSPMEFIEIPSMALEFLILDSVDHVFEGEEYDRYLKKQIEGVVTFLPWAAQMDAFQHWLYHEAGTKTNEEITIAEIDAKWLELDKMYHPFIDWEKLDETAAENRKKRWQYYHIFQAPFYYIEYAMCYMASLKIWKQSREDKQGTLKKYKESLELGGTVSLSELYKACGVEFRFDREYVRELLDFAQDALKTSTTKTNTTEKGSA